MIKTAALLYIAANSSNRVHLFSPEHGKNVTAVSYDNALGQMISTITFF
jgi:hypothetical protein